MPGIMRGDLVYTWLWFIVMADDGGIVTVRRMHTAGITMGIAARLVWAIATVLFGLSPEFAHAEDVAQFYGGKNLNLVAGFNVGGGADLYARLIARHMGKHVPGNPNVIVRNMPGAGSMAAANHIFNVAPRDGTEIGLFAGNIAVDPVIGGAPTKYDARQFNWIGAPASETAVCLASKTTSFKTFNDVLAREMVTGAAGTGTYDFPIVLNSLIGTKFKIVKGYNGSSALRLALERGEIEGFCGVGLTSVRTLGLTDDKIIILVQIAQKKSPILSDVPIVTDYAKTEEDRQVMRLVFGWEIMERPVAAPPGVPSAIVQVLRDGFDQTMADPAFRADIDKASLTYAPMNGREIAAFVDDVYRTPPDVAAKAARLLGRTR
jgi:tripartite-type tricarboxylate transporter receptor subunit TctC